MTIATKQKRYRDRQRERFLELETRFHSAVMARVGSMLRDMEPSDLLAIAQAMPVEKQATLLEGFFRELVKPKNHQIEADHEGFFATDPHAFARNGEVVFRVQLSSGPGA